MEQSLEQVSLDELENKTEDVEVEIDGNSGDEESVRDTVEAAYKALQEGEAEPTEELQQPVGSEDDEKKASKPESGEKAQVKDDVPPPPARFRAEAKEAYNKAPPEIKKEIDRMVRDYQAHETRKQNDLARKEREVDGLKQSIMPYVDDWSSQGLSAPQAIAALAAAHRKIEQNPDAAIAELIKSSGASIQQVAKILNGQPVAQTGQQQPAQQTGQRNLTPEERRIYNYVTRKEQEELSAAESAAVTELENLRETQDQQGRYIYPKLHDSAFLHQKLKPLVLSLLETSPHLSRVDAYKQAYTALEGPPAGVAATSSQETRLQTEQPRARAVSVRGKSAPATSGFQMPEDIPDDVRGTAEMALNMLRAQG